MLKKGFTIIELLIVIAIISILVGVAVPYYNDYITDARLSVLKQNLATYRNTINQFRGDNLRGPFRIRVEGAGTLHSTDLFSTANSELTAGPIQIIQGTAKRRQNLAYFPTIPSFPDPFTGQNMTPTVVDSSATAWFYDDNGDGFFNINTELAFLNGDAVNPDDPNPNNRLFNRNFDTILFFQVATSTNTTLRLDYTDITVTDSTGNTY